MAYGRWPKYVSVAERKAKAQKKIAALKKKGKTIVPVEIQGRTIARSFWGKAWCEHLEKFSDYENRLPRGRTYVRNGSVCHLQISKGRIDAIVAGSRMYNVTIEIDTLAKKRWEYIQKQCVGSIGSMVELLQGKLSDGVMLTVIDQREGLFPTPSEIHLKCNCPDWADLCKHLASVLYGVGARLDEDPSLLFLLRGVDQHELIAGGISIDTGDTNSELSGNLGDIFGIELDDVLLSEPSTALEKPMRSKAKSKATSKATSKAKSKATSKATSKAKSKAKSKATSV